MREFLIFSFIIVFASPILAQSNYEFNFKNSDSLNSYIENNNLLFHPEDIYIVKDLESYKAYTQSDFYASPIILVFNAEGKFLENIDNISSEKKLSNFKKIKSKPKKDQPVLAFLTEKIVHYETGKDFQSKNEYSFTFVINWLLITGEQKSIIIEILNEWYNVLSRQKSNGENIRIILLNMDVQDHWDLSPKWQNYVLENLNRS